MSRDNISMFEGRDHTYHLDTPLLTIEVPKQIEMGYGGRVYGSDYLRRNGSCQSSELYKCGFSFNLAFALLVVSMTLGVALYAVWLGTFREGEIVNTMFGDARTAIIVAEAYQNALGQKAHKMREQKLHRAREAQKIGVDVLKLANDLERNNPSWVRRRY